MSIGGGAAPAADKKPVSISIGGGGGSAAAPPADKKPVSISIGGASAAKKETDTTPAVGAAAATPAAVSAVKSQEAGAGR